jgi:taurine dioxygenase
MTQELHVTRLASALGAEVRGIDLAGVDAAMAKSIEQLLIEHHVLFFPDQDISVEDHVAFGAHYGELEGHPHYDNPYTDHDKIFELASSSGGIADEWHTDITFRPEPALYSILRMVKCPEVGGDTMWANLHVAFEALSPPIRDLLEGLSAIHNAEPHGRPEVMTCHPVVRVHPATGRKVLYVNEHFTRRIVEMSFAESNRQSGRNSRRGRLGRPDLR